MTDGLVQYVTPTRCCCESNTTMSRSVAAFVQSSEMSTFWWSVTVNLNQAASLDGAVQILPSLIRVVVPTVAGVMSFAPAGPSSLVTVSRMSSLVHSLAGAMQLFVASHFGAAGIVHWKSLVHSTHA